MAGNKDEMATFEYGIPVTSANRKAATPIRGGIICPPVEATASTAPAKTGLNPALFIMGMVMVSVVTTFPTALPLIIPINPLAKMATTAVKKNIEAKEKPVCFTVLNLR